MIKPTKRLSIRPFEASDTQTVKDWYYSGDYPEFFRDALALTEDQIKVYGFLKDGQGFVIRDKASPNCMVGFVLIYDIKIVPALAKIGILLDKAYQDKNYCSEVMWEMGRYVFHRMRINKLVIEVLESNGKLKQIAESHGFVHECILKNEAKIGAEYENVIRYYMFSDQFDAALKKIGDSHV